MQNVEVVEIRKIEIKINMTPDQWDPRNTQADTTRWHKARLLNQRVAKVGPTTNQLQLYTDLSRFANELGFGDSDVIIELVEYLYQQPLEFPNADDVTSTAA